ncbi:hypothetical protein SK128_011981 [Halocaridina rubra]|uniref:Uncharacterized protein n=1 Tax=Halocaridina rubra TaxID=373956 RepID=A0AAN8ZX59_HALRR
MYIIFRGTSLLSKSSLAGSLIYISHNLRSRTVALLRRTCFGRCNRYPECMPLLTSVRDGARTLDLPPQSRRRYHFATETTNVSQQL